MEQTSVTYVFTDFMISPSGAFIGGVQNGMEINVPKKFTLPNTSTIIGEDGKSFKARVLDSTDNINYTQQIKELGFSEKEPVSEQTKRMLTFINGRITINTTGGINGQYVRFLDGLKNNEANAAKHPGARVIFKKEDLKKRNVQDIQDEETIIDAKTVIRKADEELLKMIYSLVFNKGVVQVSQPIETIKPILYKHAEVDPMSILGYNNEKNIVAYNVQTGINNKVIDILSKNELKVKDPDGSFIHLLSISDGSNTAKKFDNIVDYFLSEQGRGKYEIIEQVVSPFLPDKKKNKKEKELVH